MKKTFSNIISTGFILLIIFFLVSNNCPPASEKHLKNITQLTFGGDNAEAYFNIDGTRLVFQSNYKRWGLNCDQIFLLDIAKAAGDTLYTPPLVSTGKGRTTCSYFLRDNLHLIYASTHTSNEQCPPQPPHISGKYLWPVYSSYDIFTADLQGKIVSRLTDIPGYDAEATVSPKGDKIVFTSLRSGDLDLWTMNIDGSNLKQITNIPGYDGGGTFSPDGNMIVFRASRPETESEIKEYKDFLAQGLVSPTKLEIFTCNADGSGLKQITKLGKANWSPCWHPSGKKIVFSSNYKSEKGYDFQLYIINLDGTGLEQITTESVFNSFPMFSPDGKKIVFCSNRNNRGTHDTNVFVAEWGE